MIVYEGGSVLTQARSLWRLELGRTKWSGGYVNWYHPMRIRHITTGMYLGVNGEVGSTCTRIKPPIVPELRFKEGQRCGLSVV